MGKGRILCVEYDRDFCELLTIALPEFEVVNAPTKADAIEKAKQGGFGLIFRETWLPDGTGEETCQRIRIFDTKTPILFITASRNFSETAARALAAQGMLQKTSPDFVN